MLRGPKHSRLNPKHPKVRTNLGDVGPEELGDSEVNHERLVEDVQRNHGVGREEAERQVAELTDQD